MKLWTIQLTVAALFAIGTLSALSGCENEGSVEEAAEEMADEVDDAM